MNFYPTAAAVVVLIAPAAHSQESPACESLAKLVLPNTTITLAQAVAPGAFTQRTKEQIYPGWSSGSELGWRVTAGPEP